MCILTPTVDADLASTRRETEYFWSDAPWTLDANHDGTLMKKVKCRSLRARPVECAGFSKRRRKIHPSVVASQKCGMVAHSLCLLFTAVILGSTCFELSVTLLVHVRTPQHVQWHKHGTDGKARVSSSQNTLETRSTMVTCRCAFTTETPTCRSSFPWNLPRTFVSVQYWRHLLTRKKPNVVRWLSDVEGVLDIHWSVMVS